MAETTTNPKLRNEPELLTTRNTMLCAEQIELGEIFCGHYDADDVVRRLRNVANSLERLRTLLIESMVQGSEPSEPRN